MDRLMVELVRTIKELEVVVCGYEDNLGEPLCAMHEDVEREWSNQLNAEQKARKEKEVWVNELARQLEREKQVC